MNISDYWGQLDGMLIEIFNGKISVHDLSPVYCPPGDRAPNSLINSNSQLHKICESLIPEELLRHNCSINISITFSPNSPVEISNKELQNKYSSIIQKNLGL